mmetsp:Transcript_173072/g.549486  ORF Transcript_173072/g.549486 Transcript_173072/m.549486 type:complete len:313 (+) Transcript_173072:616-1554(+)
MTWSGQLPEISFSSISRAFCGSFSKSTSSIRRPSKAGSLMRLIASERRRRHCRCSSQQRPARTSAASYLARSSWASKQPASADWRALVCKSKFSDCHFRNTFVSWKTLKCRLCNSSLALVGAEPLPASRAPPTVSKSVENRTTSASSSAFSNTLSSLCTLPFSRAAPPVRLGRFAPGSTEGCCSSLTRERKPQPGRASEEWLRGSSACHLFLSFVTACEMARAVMSLFAPRAWPFAPLEPKMPLPADAPSLTGIWPVPIVGSKSTARPSNKSTPSWDNCARRMDLDLVEPTSGSKSNVSSPKNAPLIIASLS